MEPQSKQKEKNFTEKNKALFSSTKDDWATTQNFFEKLNEEFHFDLDPCASEENHKTPEFFTREQNGLFQDWGGALRVLQSTIRESINRGMDRKMRQRSTKTKYNGCYAYTGSN